MDSLNAIKCPKCGHLDDGKYCSECGAELCIERHTALGSLKSAFSNWFIRLLRYIKTLWLLMLHPIRFFDAYYQNPVELTKMSFPLEKSWRRLSIGPQITLNPFGMLWTTLGLAAILNSLVFMSYYWINLEPDGKTQAIKSYGYENLPFIHDILSLDPISLLICIGFIYGQYTLMTFVFCLLVGRRNLPFSRAFDFAIFNLVPYTIVLYFEFFIMSFIYTDSNLMSFLWFFFCFMIFFVVIHVYYGFVMPVMILPRNFHVSRKSVAFSLVASMIATLTIMSIISLIIAKIKYSPYIFPR